MATPEEQVRQGVESIGINFRDVRNYLKANINFTYQTAEQMKNIVADAGNSNTEIVAFRTDYTGKTYKTMGDRADAEAMKIAQKADETFVATVLASAVSGAPKDFYYTLSALQNAYPNGADGVFLVLENGHIYIWNGSSWADAGTYQGIEVPVKSVSPMNTTFLVTGNQMFDKSTALQGRYIRFSDGTVQSNTSYYASGFIPVIGGTAYYKPDLLPHYAWYDVNKKYISGGSDAGTQSNVISAPANAIYLRVSVPVDIINTYMLNAGTAQLPYENFGYRFGSPDILKNSLDNIGDGVFEGSAIKKGTATGEVFAVRSLGPELVTFMEPGMNLFDINNATEGALNVNTGGIIASTTQMTTNYMPAKSGQVFNFSHNVAKYVLYNASGGYITGTQPSSAIKTLTIPTNADIALLRVDFYKPNAATFMASVGALPSTYEPYGLKISEDYLPESEEQTEDFLTYLPEEINVAEGRTIELYNKQVAWTGNIDNFHFNWKAEIGKAMKRKFSVTGDSDKIGTYSLPLEVYNNNMELIESKEATLNIVSALFNGPIKATVIADSMGNTTTSDKYWFQEIRRLSNDMITFVGTRGTAPYQHEGRSGFSAMDYLTNKAYTYENEGVQPFWSEELGRSSWNHYKQTTGVDPDVVIIDLGTNGKKLDPTENANALKGIADFIRLDDSEIPILFVNPIYRGNQDGIGVQRGTDGYAYNIGEFKLQEDRKIFNLIVRTNELLKDYHNTFIVPLSLAHDSEYNFGAVETPVNPRAVQTELLPKEATHPQEQGYLQKADIIFSYLAAYQNAIYNYINQKQAA